MKRVGCEVFVKQAVFEMMSKYGGMKMWNDHTIVSLMKVNKKVRTHMHSLSDLKESIKRML